MKISLEEINEASENYSGYCSECDQILEDSGVEPDAENYECPECGNDSLMGIENVT